MVIVGIFLWKCVHLNVVETGGSVYSVMRNCISIAASQEKSTSTFAFLFLPFNLIFNTVSDQQHVSAYQIKQYLDI